MIQFSVSALKKCVPQNKNPEELQSALLFILPKYDINTPKRIAGFLSQCGHESSDFSVLQENLNYSEAALLSVFSKYFPNKAVASSYARQPQKIANRVYASRMGNGPEDSGDGWYYRGRGAIQLTGKNNYSNFSKYIYESLGETVSYVETLAGAVESACWFWNTNKLNALADSADVRAMTKKINGGFHGLEDRQARWDRCLPVLEAEAIAIR